MTFTEQLIQKRNQNRLTSTQQEQKSGELYARAIDRILEQKNFVDKSPKTFGIEWEYGLVKSDLSPLDEATRDKVIEDANQIAESQNGRIKFVPELGAGQIEINQKSDAVFGVGASPYELLDLCTEVDTTLKQAAHANKANVLSLGIHPTAKLADTVRTSKPRYQQVPNHHKSNRLAEGFGLKDKLGISFEPDASAVALSQALQINVSAESIPQGVDMINYMMQMTPASIAILGNSRIVDGVDTGWNEARNHIWDQTHLTESGHRVLMPDNYFSNIEAVFEHMGKFPLILEPTNEQEALAIATGTNWLAGKLKFITDQDLNIKKVLAEFRPMAIQQSASQNAAAVMFALGRLMWSLQHKEPLLSFEITKANTTEASQKGLDGMFTVQTKNNASDTWDLKYIDGHEMKRIELQKAIEGLANAGSGSESELRAFFHANMHEQSPSKTLVEKVENKNGLKNKQVFQDTLIGVLKETGILG